VRFAIDVVRRPRPTPRDRFREFDGNARKNLAFRAMDAHSQITDGTGSAAAG
jgi:hypothetical protein